MLKSLLLISQKKKGPVQEKSQQSKKLVSRKLIKILKSWVPVRNVSVFKVSKLKLEVLANVIGIEIKESTKPKIRLKTT